MDTPDANERLDQLFPPTSSPVVPVPFPGAKRMKGERLYNDDWVGEAVRAQSNGDLEFVDPQRLSATQYGVTRPGVVYYLTDAYALSGETYADKDQLSNRFPLIYIKDSGESLILAGHHRSTAALLKSEPVLAIVVREPWGGSKESAKLVTPRLVVGKPARTDAVPARSVESVDAAVSSIRSGERVAVLTRDKADQVLVGLDLL